MKLKIMIRACALLFLLGLLPSSSYAVQWEEGMRGVMTDYFNKREYHHTDENGNQFYSGRAYIRVYYTDIDPGQIFNLASNSGEWQMGTSCIWQRNFPWWFNNQNWNVIYVGSPYNTWQYFKYFGAGTAHAPLDYGLHSLFNCDWTTVELRAVMYYSFDMFDFQNEVFKYATGFVDGPYYFPY